MHLAGLAVQQLRSPVDIVVAPHLTGSAQLLQVRDQVVDKAVVVVDHEDARHHRLPIVTSVSGSRGSIHGKTTKNSSAVAAVISSSDPINFPGSPPGSIRQIQPYIPISPPPAPPEARPTLVSPTGACRAR